ncbi:hypothetical protein ABIE44_003367 [Marmoricola sp. OAE513]|uniref:hypothetical protein n=1 Tax=Marmoricola sp. OAE513 TaxID=2817894 RepID=UPI001AE89EA9
MKINRIAVPIIAGVAVFGIAGGAKAISDNRDAAESETRGTCAMTSYELSAEREDGGLEASFELESAAPGETWNVVLKHNGKTLIAGDRVTDEDAEVDLDAFIGKADGDHEFTVAFTPADGETCTATLKH